MFNQAKRKTKTISLLKNRANLNPTLNSDEMSYCVHVQYRLHVEPRSTGSAHNALTLYLVQPPGHSQLKVTRIKSQLPPERDTGLCLVICAGVPSSRAQWNRDELHPQDNSYFHHTGAVPGNDSDLGVHAAQIEFPAAEIRHGRNIIIFFRKGSLTSTTWLAMAWCENGNIMPHTDISILNCWFRLVGVGIEHGNYRSKAQSREVRMTSSGGLSHSPLRCYQVTI